MKNVITYVTLFLTVFTAGTIQAQYDDLYDDPFDVLKPTVFIAEAEDDLDLETVSVEENGYTQVSDQPYQYTSQIRRFNTNFNGFNYYDPVFVDQYYFNGYVNGQTIYPDYKNPIFDSAAEVERYAAYTNTYPSFNSPYSSPVFVSNPVFRGNSGYSTTASRGFGTTNSSSGYNYCPINTGTVNNTSTQPSARTTTTRSRTSSPTYRTSTRSSGTSASGSESGGSTISFPSSTPSRSSSPSRSSGGSSRSSSPSRSSGGSRY